MSYRYVAIDPHPDALWLFDDGTPFIDYSGNGRTATSTATGKHAALVKGSDFALLVGNTTKISLNAFAVMQRGRENQSFSVSAVFRSIKKNVADVSPQQVWGNDNTYDGICISGTTVSFTTKYTSTGEARCSYDIQNNRAVRAFAVHTPEKNSLYIDGELVAEVDITDAQRADTYLADGNTITCGGTATAVNMLAVNAIAVYRQVVGEDDIELHYAEAVDGLSEGHVATAYGGTLLPLSDEHTSPFSTRTFATAEEWNEGLHAGTIVEYEQVVPELRNGISIAGTWSVTHPLPQESGTLYGVTLFWQGQGVTVQTSTDGTTWNTVTKGVRTPTIPTSFNPVGKSLFIRATFAGGVADDPSYIDDLVVTTYLAGTLPDVDGRAVTLTNVSLESNEDVKDYDENWGAELSNGSITIAVPTADSFLPKTIEIWAKKLNASAFSDNLTSPTTSNTNGTTNQAYQIDEWQLKTYTFTAGFSGAITFSGTGQIGAVVLYPYVKTAAEILESYRSYVGKPQTVVTTQGNISIVELDSLIDAYEYEWSVETAG